MRRGLLAGAFSVLSVVSFVWAARPSLQTTRPVRVLLGSGRQDVPLPSGSFRVLDRNRVVATTRPGERWFVENGRTRLRVIRGDTPAGGWSASPGLTVEPVGDDMVAWDSKTYRGTLMLQATDTAVIVINEVEVEEYLRGVLPLEIGARQADDHAAVEAQAVAARAFTYSRMQSSGTRPYDLGATDSDQVYGGSAVETLWGDLAVSATAGWVLSSQGRVVIAPYHSACGGTTAVPSEIWRGGRDTFLRSVSDISPQTGQPWCALAPRATWERRLTLADLSAAVSRLAPPVASVPPGAAVSIRDLRAGSTTPTGRVLSLVVSTASGDITVRGNDIRIFLRNPGGGELLPSTSFALAVERAPGQLRGVVIQGRGYGHGIGLCQWGAIARARAGADFRAILKAYFPGADLTRAS
jgi:stage II sporulation protein D